MTEKAIYKHLNAGDYNKAAVGLYDYFSPVYKVLKEKGATVEDVKDLFQEAVLVVMRKVVEEKEVIHCTLKTYLTTICKYQWNNKISSNKHRKTVMLEPMDIKEPIDDVKDFQEEESRFGYLGQVLQQLGERCKELLLSFYIQRLSMNEIADVMEFGSVNSAKTQKYKCIERARKMAFELSSTNSQAS